MIQTPSFVQDLLLICQIRITEKAAVRLRNRTIFSLWKAISDHYRELGSKEFVIQEVLEHGAELGSGVLTKHSSDCGIEFEIFTSFPHALTIVRMLGESLEAAASERGGFFGEGKMVPRTYGTPNTKRNRITSSVAFSDDDW